MSGGNAQCDDVKSVCTRGDFSMPYLPVLSFPGWVSGAKRPDYRQWDGGQHSEWSPLPHSAPTPHRTHVCWEFIRGSHLPSPCPWGGACPCFLGPPFPFFLNNLHFQCSFSLCSGLPLGRFAGQDGGEMQLSFSPSEPPGRGDAPLSLSLFSRSYVSASLRTPGP